MVWKKRWLLKISYDNKVIKKINKKENKRNWMRRL